MVWSQLQPKKRLMVLGGEWVGGDRPNLVLAQVQVFQSWDLGPSGPDLGPDLGPGPGRELDNLLFFVT